MKVKDVILRLQELEAQGYGELEFVRDRDGEKFRIPNLARLKVMKGYWYGERKNEFYEGELNEYLVSVHKGFSQEGQAVDFSWEWDVWDKEER